MNKRFVFILLFVPVLAFCSFYKNSKVISCGCKYYEIDVGLVYGKIYTLMPEYLNKYRGIRTKGAWNRVRIPGTNVGPGETHYEDTIGEFPDPSSNPVKTVLDNVTLTPIAEEFLGSFGCRANWAFFSENMGTKIKFNWFSGDGKGSGSIGNDNIPDGKAIVVNGFVPINNIYDASTPYADVFNNFQFSQKVDHFDLGISLVSVVPVSPFLSFYPRMGLYGSCNFFEFDLNFQGNYWPFTIIDQSSDVSALLKADVQQIVTSGSTGNFWGAGMEFGTESKWYLSGNLSLFGDFMLAILCGQSSQEYALNKLDLAVTREASTTPLASNSARIVNYTIPSVPFFVLAPVCKTLFGFRYDVIGDGGRVGYVRFGIDSYHCWNQFLQSTLSLSGSLLDSIQVANEGMTKGEEDDVDTLYTLGGSSGTLSIVGALIDIGWLI